MNQDKNTEQRIIDAAQKIFQTKGLSGARMQEIADVAGINKAMLHYYFRTKEKLFDHIFKIAANTLFPKIVFVMSSEVSLEEKVKNFVFEYITFIKSHPYLPLFIIQELSNNPERIMDIMADVKSKVNLQKLQDQITDDVNKGIIRPINADQLIVNMLALVVFPFAAKPLIKFIMNKSEEEFQEFIEERKTVVTNFILNAIKL